MPDIGEPTITMGEHGTAGPVRIELYQPLSPHTDQISTISADPILIELKLISNTLTLIYQHLTRPPWWLRLYRKVKQLCGIQ